MKKIIFTLVIATGLALTSCYKAPENGVAKIKVVDTNNVRIPSATVVLTGPVGSYINVSGVTDFMGEWEYTHDPALDVTLNVDVTSLDGTMHGIGIVRITPNEIELVTIQIG